MIDQAPLPRMEVLGALILDLPSGMGVAHLDRDPEAVPLHLVERGVHGWTHSVHHVLEKVHEVCDRVGVGLHLHILDEPVERHLSVNSVKVMGCFGRALVLVVVVVGGGVALSGASMLAGTVLVGAVNWGT